MLSCVIVMIYVDIYMYNMYVYIQWLRFMYVRRPLAGPDLLALWFVHQVDVLVISVRSQAGSLNKSDIKGTHVKTKSLLSSVYTCTCTY